MIDPVAWGLSRCAAIFPRERARMESVLLASAASSRRVVSDVVRNRRGAEPREAAQSGQSGPLATHSQGACSTFEFHGQGNGCRLYSDVLGQVLRERPTIGGVCFLGSLWGVLCGLRAFVVVGHFHAIPLPRLRSAKVCSDRLSCPLRVRTPPCYPAAAVQTLHLPQGVALSGVFRYLVS